jgi:hypothetical protein
MSSEVTPDESAGIDPNNERMIKVATTVAALAAGFVAQRALQAGWKAVTGRPAPGADDDQVSLGEIMVFTALSAAAVAVIRVWATRGARRIAVKTVHSHTPATS